MKLLSNFFLTAVISCQQLIAAVKTDGNENQHRELKFVISINFSVYIRMPVHFFHISCP